MQTDLKDLVQDFDDSPLLKGRLMRELLEADREKFRASAVPILKNASGARGCRYLITLLWTNGLLLELLCDPSKLRLEEAITLARSAARVDPQLHIRILKELLTGIEDENSRMDNRAAGRLLEILGSIADGGSILSMLAQVVRHPDARIRSKAALLIGRANKSAKWLERKMHEEDPRVRANAVEALWGVHGEASRILFRDAVKDKHNRVAGNALIGLYESGDPSSIPLFFEMREHASPSFQLTAAWAMGHTQDPRFLPVLGRMLRDHEGDVRKVVFRAITRIKQHAGKVGTQPELRVGIAGCMVLADGLGHLRITVHGAEREFLAQLHGTAFILWEDGVPVTLYSLHEHPPSEALAVAFALPRRSETGNAFDDTAVPALIDCLQHRRKYDFWAVARFAEQARSRSAVKERLFGLDISREDRAFEEQAPVYSVDSAALQKIIESTKSRSESGLPETIQTLARGWDALRGARHLILLLDRETELDDGEAQGILAALQGSHASMHVMSMAPNRPFEDLCLKTDGCFRFLDAVEQLPQALEILYSSLATRYELIYRPNRGDAPVRCRLQVVTPQGQGEDCYVISPLNQEDRVAALAQ